MVIESTTGGTSVFSLPNDFSYYLETVEMVKLIEEAVEESENHRH